MAIKRFVFQQFDKKESFSYTPQGFLRVPVYAYRTGVQIYRKKDGSILKEVRLPEDVFSEKTLDSLRGVPITMEHPKEFVNPENASKLMVGYTSDHVEVVDNKYAKTYAIITKKDAIDAVLSGKREVSMGYDLELDFSPGVYEDGQQYDAIQKNIVNNHMAIVEKGRAGKEVRIRLDGESAIQIDETEKTKEDLMKVKIGDKEYDMSDEAGKAVMDMMKAHKSEMDGMKKKKDEADEELTSLKESNTKLEAKCDSLEDDIKKAGEKKESNMDAAEVSKLVRQRRRIDRVAEKVLDKETLQKLDSMDDIEVQKAVLEKEVEGINLDGKDEAYISARFDHIAEKAVTSEKENKKISNKDNQETDKTKEKNKDGEGENQRKDSAEIREDNMKKDQEAWKQPLGKSKGGN